jgi:predicted dehydrogenase
LTAAHSARQLDAAAAGTDEEEAFADPAVDVIFAITRHDQHARQVQKAIRAGKHIFVEKPLCLTLEELAAIQQAIDEAGAAAPQIMVGFNRRFAPAAVAAKRHFQAITGPLTVSIRFNAGSIPAEHWTQHPIEGGGRIVGEACHAIDLATFLTGSVPIRVYAESVGDPAQTITDDQCLITLRHANGSVSGVGYFAGGDKGCPKERVEVFGGGRTAIIEDFRTVTTWAQGRCKIIRGRQQKGHLQELEAFADALRSQSPSICWEEIRAVSLASILAVQSIREGVPFDVPTGNFG